MNAAATFTLGPLSLTAEPAELDAWVAKARPATRLTYARGLVTPRAAAGFLHARTLHERGLVDLHEMPGEFRRERLWIMVRRPSPDALPAPSPASPNRGELAEVLILNAIADGGACPTNGEIASALGLRDAVAGAAAVRAAKKRGRVKIVEQAPGMRRVAIDKQTHRQTREARL